MEQLAQRQKVSPFYFAYVYLGLNERETALRWLQRSAQDRENLVLWIASDTKWEPLRNDPRFIALLKQIGLPQ